MSDFGLTKAKEQLACYCSAQDNLIEGSIQWMAPELLSENPDIDYVMADVYSFGIILWELLTREQPYAGMTYAPACLCGLSPGGGFKDKMRNSPES